MVMVRWNSVIRLSLLGIVLLVACRRGSPSKDGATADAAGSLDAVADPTTPDAGGADGARDLAPPGTDGNVDGPARETLLPEVDAGTCRGTCIDRWTAPCPFVGFSCLSMTDGDNTYACYSNGVKVQTTTFSNGSRAYRVVKADGNDCYVANRIGNDEAFSVSNAIEATLTYNYDGAGNNRVVCRDGTAYQYAPASPACVAEQQATMACTPGSCVF